jgi:hypothetical protein
MIYYAANVVSEPEKSGDALDYIDIQEIGVNRLKITFKGKEAIFDGNGLTQSPDIASAYVGSPSSKAFSDTQKLAVVWDSERFNSRSTASSLLDRKGLANLTDDIVVVGFAEGDMWVYCRHAVKSLPEGAEVTNTAVANVQPRDWLSAESPELAALVRRNRAKRKLLAHVKPENSIAALEKQVDLLTLVVAELVANRPAPDWFPLLENVVSLKGSNTVMDVVESIEEVSINKTEVRALQSEYFTART